MAWELDMPKSGCTPSISAIERSLPVTRQDAALVCLSCGNTMKHVRTIPRLGVRPKLLVFVCPSCREVDVREHKTLARKKAPAKKIAKALTRTEGATRQKAFSMGLSLDSRA